MRIAVFCADERFSLLQRMLSENGADVMELSDGADASDRDVYIGKYPPDERFLKAIRRAKEGAALIFLNTVPVPEGEFAGFSVRSLLDDALFVNENALLTAEGAVYCAMRQAPFALQNENVTVVGYGRIGRQLTELLIALGARVTVVSRRESGRLQAMARGANAASREKLPFVLMDSRVIFVTSPDPMLSAKELASVKKSAYLFDLSGAPYGVDLECALKMGLNARRESALPARYAPESAAKAMYRAVRRVLGGMEK